MKMQRAAIPAFLLSLAGCASVGGDEIDPVEARLNALESETSSLRQELADQERIVQGMSAVGLGSSVAALEEQFRALRGQVEQMGYEAEVRSERQKALYLDLDQRLSALESGARNRAVSTGTPTSSNQDQKAYLAAFQKMKGNNYPAAIAQFSDFLSRFPESPYAPNAQYWIGEAHYVQREFDQAWNAFARVLKRFPASDKAADALLKQALVRVEQGQGDEARKLLKRVQDNYPASSAAKLAAERLQQMGGDA